MNIRPALVNRALEKLIEVNHFYKDVTSNPTWENDSQEFDPQLWSMLTDENAVLQIDKLDSEDEIEDNNKNAEIEQQIYCQSQPTLLQNIDGPELPNLANQVDVAPCENEIPVSFYSEPDWEALAFPGHYPDAKNYFNSPRERNITPSKYVHARLKSSDDRFASDPQYIFNALHWTESSNVASAISFSQKKHFAQSLFPSFFFREVEKQ